MKRLGRPPKSLAKAKPAPVETVSSRVGGRERKAKKVFDPSENNTPKKRTKISKSTERAREEYVEQKIKSRSSKSVSPKSKYSAEEYCSVCNKEEKKLKALVNCNDCNLKAHIDCLKTKFEDKKLLQSKWRCDNCKTCAICYETEEIGALITCSVCINSYHITCHVPKVNTKTVNYQNWRCTKCPMASASKHQTNQVPSKPSILKPQIASASNSISSMTSENSSSSFSSNATQQSTSKKELNNSNIIPVAGKIIKEEISETNNAEVKQNIDKKIFRKFEFLNEVPDISSWSCETLADFMKKIFPYESKLLKDQDMDGQSLLLMTRKDVLSLNLKLGPALRLYNFILGLQTRKYDNLAAWIF